MGKRTVIATFSTWVTPTIAINKGEMWDADDQIVRDHPDWFTDDPEVLARLGLVHHSGTPTPPAATVESASAAPGEKRTTTTPRTARA